MNVLLRFSVQAWSHRYDTRLSQERQVLVSSLSKRNLTCYDLSHLGPCSDRQQNTAGIILHQKLYITYKLYGVLSTLVANIFLLNI